MNGNVTLETRRDTSGGAGMERQGGEEEGEWVGRRVWLRSTANMAQYKLDYCYFLSTEPD